MVEPVNASTASEPRARQLLTAPAPRRWRRRSSQPRRITRASASSSSSSVPRSARANTHGSSTSSTAGSRPARPQRVTPALRGSSLSTRALAATTAAPRRSPRACSSSTCCRHAGAGGDGEVGDVEASFDDDNAGEAGGDSATAGGDTRTGARGRKAATTVGAAGGAAFGQRFPAYAAARALAFGAGGLAEELGDLRGAVDEYTRAIVLAPLLGTSGADALLARARVRTRLGDLDEARADLRVLLQSERRPAATHSDEVQGLARALRVELP